MSQPHLRLHERYKYMCRDGDPNLNLDGILVEHYWIFRISSRFRLGIFILKILLILSGLSD